MVVTPQISYILASCPLSNRGCFIGGVVNVIWMQTISSIEVTELVVKGRLVDEAPGMR